MELAHPGGIPRQAGARGILVETLDRDVAAAQEIGLSIEDRALRRRIEAETAQTETHAGRVSASRESKFVQEWILGRPEVTVTERQSNVDSLLFAGGQVNDGGERGAGGRAGFCGDDLGPQRELRGLRPRDQLGNDAHGLRDGIGHGLDVAEVRRAGEDECLACLLESVSRMCLTRSWSRPSTMGCGPWFTRWCD